MDEGHPEKLSLIHCHHKSCDRRRYIHGNFLDRSVAPMIQKESHAARKFYMHQGRLVAHLVVIIVVIIASLVFLIIVLILHVITKVLSCLGVVDGLAAGAAATLDDVAGVNGLEVILSIILLIWKDTKLVSGRVIGGRAHVASKHSLPCK
jgi:hypothetical protein